MARRLLSSWHLVSRQELSLILIVVLLSYVKATPLVEAFDRNSHARIILQHIAEISYSQTPSWSGHQPESHNVSCSTLYISPPITWEERLSSIEAAWHGCTVLAQENGPSVTSFASSQAQLFPWAVASAYLSRGMEEEGVVMLRMLPSGWQIPLHLATQYADRRDWSATIQWVDRANAVNPVVSKTNIEVARLKCQAWLGLGKASEALPMCTTYVTLTDSSPDALYLLGLVYLNLGDFQSARDVLAQIVPLDNLSYQLLVEAGRAYYYTGELASAKALFSRAIDKCPGCAYAHLYMGKVLLQEQRLSDAALHLEIAASSRTPVIKEEALELLNQLDSYPGH